MPMTLVKDLLKVHGLMEKIKFEEIEKAKNKVK